VDFVANAALELQAILNHAEGIPVVIRLHDSGDFYSKEYVMNWLKLAELFPMIEIYSYTKSWKLVDECCKEMGKPNNFNYIPSRGGKDDNDLGHRPCAMVVPVGTTLLPVGTVMGTKDDLANLQAVMDGFTLALEAHGAKRTKVGRAV
jgi:hypothetical protein